MGKKKETRIIPVCPKCNVEGNMTQDENSMLVTCLTCAWVGKEKEIWDTWAKKPVNLHKRK